MKPHLPLPLAAAVLAAFVSVPAYSSTLYSPLELTSGKIEDSVTYELLNGKDYTYPRTEANAPFLSGATGSDSLTFTAATGQDDVALSFAGGNTQVFYEIKDLSFQNLTRLKFSRLTSGAIYSESGSTATPGSLVISGITDKNNATNDVEFSNNSNTGNCGGAINAINTTVSIYNNGGVLFEVNKAKAGTASSENQSQESTSTSVGLGVGGSQGFTLNLFGFTLSYEFAFKAGLSYEYDDPDTEEVERMDICGGAINLLSSDLSMRGNEAVTFVKNSAVDYGGAISVSPSYGAKLNRNGCILFEENTATGHIKENTTTDLKDAHVDGGCGGAIFIGNKGHLEMDGNTGDIIFKNNLAAAAGGAIYSGEQDFDSITNSIALTNNEGNISFEGNTAVGTGGAIFLQNGGKLLIADNKGDVNFENNQAGISGGAISALNATVTIEHNTEDVIFRDNLAYHQGINDEDSFEHKYVGGAIYGTNIQIHNNNSVLFQRNAEILDDGSFRLRSLYVEDVDDSALESQVSLSAGEGKTIEFHDSIYIAAGINLYLNSEYADHKQEGDIIFTGATTVDDLEKVKEDWLKDKWTTEAIDTTPTVTEIAESRTSIVLGTTYLNGGRLIVEKGAIFKSYNIELNEGSNSTLRIDDAKVANIFSNGDIGRLSYIKVYNGSTLEILGNSTIEGGKLIFNDGANWSFGLSDKNLETAALTFTRGHEVTIEGKLTVNLDVKDSNMNERYCLYQGSSDAYKTLEKQWTADKIIVNGLNDAKGAGFDDLVWLDKKLYYISSMVWGNNQGTWVWNKADENWQNGKTFADGMNVKFTDTAAGEVKLSGTLSAGVITVANSTGNDYTFTAADGGGSLTGFSELVKRGTGSLSLDLANDYTGFTKLEEGTLNLHDDKALGGSVLKTAVGTTLGVGDGAHVVLDGVENNVYGKHDIAGNVKVDAGATLEIKGEAGSGYKAPKSTVEGTLVFTDTQASADTLAGNGNLQVKNSQVDVNNIKDFKGDISVNGSNATLSAKSEIWTEVSNHNRHIDVNGGKLSLEGNLTAVYGTKIGLSTDASASTAATIAAKEVIVSSGAELAVSKTVSELTLEVGSFAVQDDSAVLNSAIGGVIDAEMLTLGSATMLTLNQSHIDMNGGALTLALWDSNKIHLSLTLDGELMEGSSVILFSGVSALSMVTSDNTTEYTGSYEFYANEYFSGSMIGEDTMVKYQDGAITVTGLVIPEPTTATLSLLALAGLAARRRRK